MQRGKPRSQEESDTNCRECNLKAAIVSPQCPDDISQFQSIVMNDVMALVPIYKYKAGMVYEETYRLRNQSLIEIELELENMFINFSLNRISCRCSEHGLINFWSIVPHVSSSVCRTLLTRYHFWPCLFTLSFVSTFSTGRQWTYGKVIFSIHQSVCLSLILSTGGPMWPLPIMHWTSLYRDPLVTSSGHHWTPDQTCSL